ncbi:regulatory protein, TetR [Rhodovulum sp. PH10]|uniref:TetR/AcrR family transcriptional regulator n=1 Tax=Rhodovulum sp. PH10 TaxID=1187851 RepID=UPI00027C26CC|nr:TetR/AcrR family transcriptional regulator [Rhodovulum sp. PH10]EJW10219.1 regulatory protein, TetR [Rhodovulum sp. PH10]
MTTADSTTRSAPRRAKPRKAATTPETAEPTRRARILQAAERLFALEGFHGTSMRNIADAAGVGLSIVVYHFETKQNLYRKVFEEHLGLFEARLAALAEVADPTAPDAVERIVEAFVMPVMRLQGTAEGQYYSMLTVREASDPQERSRGILRDYYDPMAREFIAALQRALPDKSPDYLHWAYLFAVGALVMNFFDERMERLSEHRCKPGDLPTKGRYLVQFIAAGIRGGPDVGATAKRTSQKD